MKNLRFLSLTIILTISLAACNPQGDSCVRDSQCQGEFAGFICNDNTCRELCTSNADCGTANAVSNTTCQFNAGRNVCISN